MNSNPTWHIPAIAQLSRHFEQDPEVRAVLLAGSLAGDAVQADVWSDVDVKVILTDQAVERYYARTDWLEPWGYLVGLERHDSPSVKTLRVCLEGFQRFDFVFIAESMLRRTPHVLRQPCKVLWSRLPDLETYSDLRSPASEYHNGADADLNPIADSFWFKATVAITKVARNDVLIGMHLALDLARDCLVLQMMQRDREKGTTIHRVGGWGNDLVDQLVFDEATPSAQKILDLIEWSCRTFDSLATALVPAYSPRAAYLLPTLDAARGIP